MAAIERVLVLSVALVAGGCVSTARPAPGVANASFDPVAFFDGHTEGIGRLRIVLHHADRTLVEGSGHTEGPDTIVLDQAVRRGDDAPTHRRWRLTRTAPGRYDGTLSDAAGPVVGDVRGGRLHLTFRMRGGLQAQQWLDLEPGGRTARNVMLVTKLGVPVARLDEAIVRR